MIIVVEVKTREAGCELPGELIDFRKSGIYFGREKHISGQKAWNGSCALI